MTRTASCLKMENILLTAAPFNKIFAFSRKMWENKKKCLEMQERLKGECHAGKSNGETASGKGDAAK